MGEAAAESRPVPLVTVGNDIAVTADINRTSWQHAGPPANRGAGGVVPRPGLFERMGGPARVTMVSAPPGSGKTILLRSWIAQAGLAGCAAWVSVGRDEWESQGFWLTVLNALGRTPLASSLVPAPDQDGCRVPERLLMELASLRERLWLVIDDVHELGPEALRLLELLVLRAPPQLRFVLASRHDVRLGLHRLRLAGELAEIRAADLRFTVPEARELFAAAGLDLPDSTVLMLHQRTEGWAAGLRLAALSLAVSPDPDQFAADFSGTERTVAEYLVAEVLDRQPEAVRRLLLRTSILERVNGELADLLTGDQGGQRILQDLEQANAFVASLDASRSEFRYHPMFAGLLALELRRTAPEELVTLHQAASAWFSTHGYPVEAVRHAQAVHDWGLAARLLADHWPSLYLDGQAAASHELLAGFPAEMRGTDAALAAMTAADELAHGSAEAADRYLDLAERGTAAMPGNRRSQARLLLGISRLLLARQRGDRLAESEQARRLEEAAEADAAIHPRLAKDLRTLALTGPGAGGLTAEYDEAQQRLRRGITLAQQTRRPFLESTGLAHLAAVEAVGPHARGADHARRAIELAERHGWTDEQPAGVACVVLGALLCWQGRLAEAAPWVQRAERSVRAEGQPIAGMGVYLNRALLELGRGRKSAALAACRSFERQAELIPGPHPAVTVTRAFQLQLLALLGETEQAELVLARLREQGREGGEIRVAVAGLRLAQDEPDAAAAALAPVLDGSVPLIWPAGLVQALLLDAITRDVLGDPNAADRALERALDEAEPAGTLLPFLLYPAPRLLERHTRHRTAHAALVGQIQDLLAGNGPAPPTGPRAPTEPLSDSELRVLRYLPTNLTAPEIARELCVSINTVKTHLRNLYTKLGTHRRAEAVARARALGLLAPSPRRLAA